MSFRARGSYLEINVFLPFYDDIIKALVSLQNAHNIDGVLYMIGNADSKFSPNKLIIRNAQHTICQLNKLEIPRSHLIL